MMNENEIRYEYEYELALAALDFSKNVGAWKRRRILFRTVYTVGNILRIPREQVDEDFSEAIMHELERQTA